MKRATRTLAVAVRAQIEVRLRPRVALSNQGVLPLSPRTPHFRNKTMSDLKDTFWSGIVSFGKWCGSSPAYARFSQGASVRTECGTSQWPRCALLLCSTAGPVSLGLQPSWTEVAMLLHVRCWGTRPHATSLPES